MTHQEESASVPYVPEATERCPSCDSENFARCKCQVGDHRCGDCGFKWRVGKLYWIEAETEQPAPLTIGQVKLVLQGRVFCRMCKDRFCDYCGRRTGKAVK